MIKVRGLSKHYGKFKAIDDLNLHVKEGSVYGLLGPNGAGKTTLIKHLVGVYSQDSGSITISDRQVFENPEVKSSIAYISDELYFYSQYSIDETAKFYSCLYPEWNWERYELLKEVFPIESKRRITRLSKGMQKQAAFWLGISTMPKIMVLDEPVDGLDPVMRKKVWNLILQDVEARGTTVLVSSHNLRELEGICDHVGILHNGRIVVEREIDSMKADIHKLQIAFSGEIPCGFLEGEEILHSSMNGSILLLIVKGDKDKLISNVKKYNPAVMDILPLSLEEIFIYELGGMGYEIQNIII